MMFHRSAATALLASAVLAATCTSSNAFLAAAPRTIRSSQRHDNNNNNNISILMATATPPPAVTTVASSASSAPTAPSTTASNLPSQKELLDKSSSSSSAAASKSAATTTKGGKAPPPTGGITITSINYDGQVPKTESDEYITLTNNSKTPIDISGYYVYVATTGTQGPTFTFPNKSSNSKQQKGGTVLEAGQSVRIYTNEIHKESGGYSFGSGKAIWSNKGGLAVLKDGSGKKIGEFKY